MLMPQSLLTGACLAQACGKCVPCERDSPDDRDENRCSSCREAKPLPCEPSHLTKPCPSPDVSVQNVPSSGLMGFQMQPTDKEATIYEKRQSSLVSCQGMPLLYALVARL